MITSQQATAFIRDMQHLIATPEFSRLDRYNQERSWLAYLPLRENHYCSLLAWLLNPREGHGLGDFFLKQLLTEANTIALKSPSSSVNKRFNQRLENNIWIELDEIVTSSLQSALIAQEVPIEIVHRSALSKRRLDILVIDPISKLAIVIERKDGSKIHSDQLQHYKKWVEQQYPGYYQLFILSDSHRLKHDLEDACDWVQLDDRWLIQALKESLIPGRLAENMHQRFEDLLYHFDQAGAYREPFYYDIEKEIDQFSLTYRDTIQRLRLNPFTKLRYSDILTRLLPHAEKKEETLVRRALILACRYPILLNDLLSRASLTELSNQLAQQHPDLFLAFDIHDEILHISTQDVQMAYESGDISDWPIYLTLNLPHQPRFASKELEESRAPSLPTLSLSLDLHFLGKEHLNQLREIGKKFGLSLKRRWADKYLEFLSEEDALNNPGRFGPWIQEMYAMTRELDQLNLRGVPARFNTLMETLTQEER